ncbi:MULTISPECIES: hypothetical protein [Natrinema]|uniref:Uncharacterized protein n=1 Tax=Natrinema gari JCM 14663 TaxID=1230459 RepID=L9YYL9_9EURY|nr:MULTISPECIES: hypothetical protein [Natrinema]AFO59430.1 hypothetical protein NJ7G_4216 [Natrinema sp. J7-2]ELY77993.1 hypothetical protein C486_14017 [Natrinema gari JCM 14663]
MIDREGRVIFGSLLLVVLSLAGSIAVERQFGVGIWDRPFLAFLLFAGVTVAVPQLYLAATDDNEGRFRSRVRFAAVATATLAIVFAADADGGRHLVIALLGTGSIVALVCYEVVADYRTPSDDSVTGVP